MNHRCSILVAASVALAGCANFLPATGPTVRDVQQAPQDKADYDVRVVDLNESVVRRMIDAYRQPSLSEAFGTGNAATLPRYTIEPGDALELSVWEAPPAALFGAPPADVRGLASSSRVAVLPEQVVNAAGNINMPFAGIVHVAGMAPEQVETEIARRLKSKANDPQVLVRVLRNSSSSVTVVGEVNLSARMPLSPRGDRLLDALAAAGGFRQPVGKITIRLTRQVNEGGRLTTRVVSLPLESVITDPAQNILLLPGDVISALFLPNSFTVLGATTRNEEINFEAPGITLAQALARAGGLQDQRSNATGVFVFRFEDPAVLGETNPVRTTLDGKIPVVYRVDLKEPASFFLSQNFPMRNRDLLYVANAPGAELQKFMNLLSGVVLPIITIRNVGN